MRRITFLDLADCGRAVCELGLARLRLGALEAKAILAQAYEERRSSGAGNGPDNSDGQRVGRAIGRMAARVPWRSSCLVQALAAKRWLSAKGHSSSLYLGVRKLPAENVEAHAWLMCDGEVVTGGDPTGFILLLSPPLFARARGADTRVPVECRSNVS